MLSNIYNIVNGLKFYYLETLLVRVQMFQSAISSRVYQYCIVKEAAYLFNNFFAILNKLLTHYKYLHQTAVANCKRAKCFQVIKACDSSMF